MARAFRYRDNPCRLRAVGNRRDAQAHGRHVRYRALGPGRAPAAPGAGQVGREAALLWLVPRRVRFRFRAKVLAGIPGFRLRRRSGRAGNLSAVQLRTRAPFDLPGHLQARARLPVGADARRRRVAPGRCSASAVGRARFSVRRWWSLHQAAEAGQADPLRGEVVRPRFLPRVPNITCHLLCKPHLGGAAGRLAQPSLRRRAMSGEIAERPLTTRDKANRVTPGCRAASVAVSPRAGSTPSRNVSAGFRVPWATTICANESSFTKCESSGSGAPPRRVGAPTGKRLGLTE